MNKLANIIRAGLKFSEISFIILLGSISSAGGWSQYAGVELTFLSGKYHFILD